MELADYLRVLRRRWWLILLVVVICTAGAVAASYTQTPRYTTTTRLLVSGIQGGNAIDEIARRQLANQRAVAYSQLVSTGPAVAAAVRRSGMTGAAQSISASADGSSPFVVVTVQANSARAAQAIANAYVTVLPEVIQQLEETPTASAPELSVLEEAPLPAQPTSPVHERDILLGLVIGAILGVAGALVRETLDARVRDSAELEKITGVTLLGSIPRELSGDLLPARTRPRSGRAESYRHVRTNLEFTGPEGMPRSILVTSPAPGEGKSSLSANLAVAAARSGRRVALVDADLRKPSMTKYFDVQASLGLSDVLSGRWGWQEALVPVEGENIEILTSGPVPRFPSELVGSAVMAQLIQELEVRFDLVIIDSPPVLPVSDALVIGVNVGGVIVVARMVETRRAALKRAVEAVRKVNANLLGVVGNAVIRQEEKAYGEGYGYAYGYISQTPADTLPPPTTIRPATRRRARHSAGDQSDGGHSDNSLSATWEAAQPVWEAPAHPGPQAPESPAIPLRLDDILRPPNT